MRRSVTALRCARSSCRDLDYPTRVLHIVSMRPRRAVGMSLACLAAFALSGCGNSAGAGSSSAGRHRAPSRSDTLNNDGLAFNYPPAWRAVHYEATSSFTYLITYLSDQRLHSPCTSHKVSGGTEL